MTADVAFWHIADIAEPPINVRFLGTCRAAMTLDRGIR